MLKTLHKKLKVEDSLDGSVLVNFIDFLSNKFSSEDFDKYFATILKYFFDADLLGFDFLLKWGESDEEVKSHFLFDESKD